MIFALIYLLLCVLVANYAKNRTYGFLQTLIFSLILTPIVGLIVTLLSKEVIVKQTYKCKHCGFVSVQNADFCPACEKDDKGLTKEHYKAKAHQ